MTNEKLRSRLKKMALIGGVVAVAYFAVQGGEYSTTALLAQRERERMLKAAIDSLSRGIDSLKDLRDKLERDPAYQERVAREMYGMVKGDKEIVYRFIDTARSRP